MFLCKWRARKQISLHRDNKVVLYIRGHSCNFFTLTFTMELLNFRDVEVLAERIWAFSSAWKSWWTDELNYEVDDLLLLWHCKSHWHGTLWGIFLFIGIYHHYCSINTILIFVILCSSMHNQQMQYCRSRFCCKVCSCLGRRVSECVCVCVLSLIHIWRCRR